MDVATSRQRWGRVARTFHWLIAAMLVIQISLGWLAEGTEDRTRSFALIHTHFQFGLVLLALMLMRLAWRIATAAPEPLPDEPAWRRGLAHLVHGALYLLVLTLPVSGYVIWVHMHAPMDIFGIVTLPVLFTPPVEDETLRAGAWYVHYVSGWLLILLAAIHILAACWHQYVRRDELLERMVG